MPENKTQIFLKGVSVTSIFTVASGVLGLVYFSVMSRLLTKEDFGYFAALTGIMAVVGVFSEGGIGATVIQKKNPTKSFISTAFTMSLLMGLGCFIIMFTGAPFFANLVADDYLTTPIRVMAISLLMSPFISIGRAQLYRDLQFTKIGAVNLVSALVAVISSILLAYKGFGVFAMISYALASNLATCLIFVSLGIRYPHVGIVRQHVKGIISFGGWLTLSDMFNKMASLLDRLVLPKLTSVRVLGEYTRPSSFLFNISGIISDVIDRVLFPMLSKSQDEHEAMRSVFYRGIELLNTFSIILAAVFFFNAQLIITIFFGSEWLSLTIVLQILSLTVIFQIDNQLTDCFFRSLNLVKTGFYMRVIFLISVFVAIVVGAKFGVVGIAVAVSIANISVVLLRMIVLGRKMGASIRQMVQRWFKAWKAAMGPIIIGVVFMSLPHSLLNEILCAIIMTLAIAAEMLLFPKFVGDEYQVLIAPFLSKFHIKSIH